MARSTRLFFFAAFALTWGLQLPAVLAHHGLIAGPPERYMGLVGLGALGPMFAAMIAARREGAGEVRALLAQLTRWRVGPGWYLVALGLSGALFTAGRAVYGLFGGEGPWCYPPDEAPRLLAMVFFPVGEEIGWRGYALPRLQARVGGLRASVIVGAFWCLWHAMMFDLAGIPGWMLLAMAPFFVAGSVVFTWLWNRTAGSLLLAVLMHVGAHLDNSNRPLPTHVAPALLHTAAYVVFACALVALDRRAVEGSREAPHPGPLPATAGRG